jgi:hypothetical protein
MQEIVDLYWFGLLGWIDCYDRVTGVPIASLYTGRDSYGAITILVRCKEGVLILITEGTFYYESG